MIQAKTSRFERITDLMLTLMASTRPITMIELVNALPGYPLEGSEDTLRAAFERDKRLLRENAVGIVTQGPDGKLTSQYRWERLAEDALELELSEDERQTLALALAISRWTDGAGQSAMAKLASARSPFGGDEAWWTLAVVKEAVASRRSLRFAYRGRTVYAWEGSSASPWTLPNQVSSPLSDPTSQIVAGNYRADGYYGGAESASGNFLVVGAIAGDGSDGRVYLFEDIDGTYVKIASMSDPNDELADDFGASVAVAPDGSNYDIAVGAPGTSDGGEAYIFSFPSNIEENGTITEESSYRELHTTSFGTSVALTSSQLVVGDPGSNEAFVYSGSVSGMMLADALADPGSSGSDAFGTSVTIDAAGGQSIVGAPGENAAYGFSGGTLVDTLTVAGAGELGQSIADNDGEVVIGAPTTGGAGAAFVFTWGSGIWTMADELSSPDGTASSGFGTSVAVDDDWIVAGAPNDGSAGDAFAFPQSGGTIGSSDELAVSQEGPSDNLYGQSVAVVGDQALIGAPHSDGNLGDSYDQAGSIYTWVASE